MSDMTDDALTEIEARAKAAMPGPWSLRRSDQTIMHLEPGRGYFTIAPVECWDKRPETAAHIAGMDPPTTLLLCASLRNALTRAERSSATAEVAAAHVDRLIVRAEKAEAERDALVDRIKPAAMAYRAAVRDPKADAGKAQNTLAWAVLRALGVEP